MLDVDGTLVGLAEVAIALAGFSAIFVVARRSTGGAWEPRKADLGMHVCRFPIEIVERVCEAIWHNTHL